ncbi:hypothetical protein H1R20_g8700, partial [Candolleomyces eurysporus]
MSRAGTLHIQVERLGKQETFAPEEILAMQLSKLKSMAEDFIQGKVGKAVVSIPPGSSAIQRQAIKDACEIAGVRDPLLLSETSAAAVYYTFYSHAHEKLGDSDLKTVLLVDVGASTTSVAVTNIEAGVIEVKAVASDHRLGGDAFDQLFVNYVAKELQTTHKVDLGRRARTMARLAMVCEKAKRALSSAQKAQIDLEGVSENINIASMVITRDTFESICSGLCRAMAELVTAVISQSELNKADIHEVLLVGGATRMPCIIASIQSCFLPHGPSFVTIRNLDEAVAYGCAIQSAVQSGCSEEPLDNMILLDVLHHSLGVAVIPKYDPLSEDTDYLPADGGSPHESVLKTVIKRNTTIPAKRQETLSTATYDQTTAHIQVYEGDHDDPSRNTFLGSFELHGIPKPPFEDQLAKVEVTFDLSCDGSCVVHAAHKEYGYATRSLAIRVGTMSQHAKRAMIERAKMLDGECSRVYRLRRS